MEMKLRIVVTSGRRELAANGHKGTFLNDNSVMSCLGVGNTVVYVS